MVQSMRLGNQSQKSKDVNPYKNVRMNMISSLDAMLVGALNSNIPTVKDKATEVYRSLKERGFKSLLDAGDEITDKGVQQLISLSSEASKADNTLQSDYSTVGLYASFYNEGTTDEEYAEYQTNQMDSLRSSDRAEHWDTKINPVTGNKIEVNSKTGAVRPYVDVVDDIEALEAQSDAEFSEYIQSGGTVEGYSVLGDSELAEV